MRLASTTRTNKPGTKSLVLGKAPPRASRTGAFFLEFLTPTEREYLKSKESKKF